MNNSLTSLYLAFLVLKIWVKSASINQINALKDEDVKVLQISEMGKRCCNVARILNDHNISAFFKVKTLNCKNPYSSFTRDALKICSIILKSCLCISNLFWFNKKQVHRLAHTHWSTSSSHWCQKKTLKGGYINYSNTCWNVLPALVTMPFAGFQNKTPFSLSHFRIIMVQHH